MIFSFKSRETRADPRADPRLALLREEVLQAFEDGPPHRLRIGEPRSAANSSRLWQPPPPTPRRDETNRN